MNIYFWHRILSPHMTPLAQSLCDLGVNVTIVYSEDHSAERKALGWISPDTSRVRVLYEPDPKGIINLASTAPADSIHICEGFRNNGLVSAAQGVISTRNLTQFVILETVRSVGLKGFFRDLLYCNLIKRKKHISGVLAIGKNTPKWLIDRGFPKSAIFPFTYFLALREPIEVSEPSCRSSNSTRPKMLFVGQLIKRKGVDILLNSLLDTCRALDVWIVGVGPERSKLKKQAARLPDNINVEFFGRRSIFEIQSIMADADFLVLPSREDGWGAVVSEALMVGTPVICSDACGASEVVELSGLGGVFKSSDVEDLAERISSQITAPLSNEERINLSDWASALSGDAGARYLLDIISYSTNSDKALRPVPPWQSKYKMLGSVRNA